MSPHKLTTIGSFRRRTQKAHLNFDPDNLAALHAQVADQPSAWALFLDLDGTLLEIAERPGDVLVPMGLVDCLRDIRAGLHGALAIVSGRPMIELDRLLHPVRLDVAGEHGAKLRLMDGPEMSFGASIKGTVLEAIHNEIEALDGVMVETKEATVAVHYRENPEVGATLETVLKNILAKVGAGIRLLPGRFVFELVPSHASKALAVECFLSHPPFQGRIPIFIGDDKSDEEACRYVEQIGGIALPVAGEHFDKSRAAFSSPNAVRKWVSSLATDLRR